MTRPYRRRISAGMLAAVLLLVMSVTAYAATQLFSSKQVAEHLGEQVLAQAFAGPDAIEINQSIASGDYSFTLHGIVTGAGLKELSDTSNPILPDRTYAVVSIERQDGGQMPHTSDPEYGKDPFFISPLIKHQKPWLVNIVTMGGGYSEIVLDGIMYRLIECDGVEMFADRGVYLAISSGSSFFSLEAFAYDESTGEVSARADYPGASLLFELPLDKAKADHAKADAYLQELLKETSADTKGEEPIGADADAAAMAEAELMTTREELMRKLPSGTLFPDSVKEVTYDKQGRIHYEYESWSVTMLPDMLFSEGQTGFSEVVNFSGDDSRSWAMQFSRDENGVITGRVLDLN